MSLHYSNDPIGQLIQCRSVMEKDGLVLGIFMGGQTLNELRDSIALAEIELTGGISPRVLPMIDVRDAGSFLMRAGFALPVADINVTTIDYKKPLDLLYDLRKMGETNVQKHRQKKFSHRKLFFLTSDKYIESQNSKNDIIKATFEFITNELGSQGAVLAGGRYNDLMKQMGGPDLSGIGWASGIERLILSRPKTFLIKFSRAQKTFTHLRIISKNFQ